VLNKEKIIKVLKEEYESRINYFLKERLSIKDKRGENLIKDAIGLKVRDKAGFEYTVAGIIKKGKEEYVKLYLPEFGRKINGQESTAPLNEFDDADDYESNIPQRGFISRNSAGLRKVDYDVESGFAGQDYLDNDYKSDDANFDSKEPTSYSKNKETKYILVPLGEFEERFEV
jgi:hypothetical protein